MTCEKHAVDHEITTRVCLQTRRPEQPSPCDPQVKAVVSAGALQMLTDDLSFIDCNYGLYVPLKPFILLQSVYVFLRLIKFIDTDHVTRILKRDTRFDKKLISKMVSIIKEHRKKNS